MLYQQIAQNKRRTVYVMIGFFNIGFGNWRRDWLCVF